MTPPIPPLCDWIRLINGVVEVSTPRWLFPNGRVPKTAIVYAVKEGEGGFAGDGLEHDWAPLTEMLPYVGEQWSRIEFLNPWFKPYLLGRIKAAWYDGGQPDIASQWDKWFTENP